MNSGRWQSHHRLGSFQSTPAHIRTRKEALKLQDSRTVDLKRFLKRGRSESVRDFAKQLVDGTFLNTAEEPVLTSVSSDDVCCERVMKNS